MFWMVWCLHWAKGGQSHFKFVVVVPIETLDGEEIFYMHLLFSPSHRRGVVPRLDVFRDF